MDKWLKTGRLLSVEKTGLTSTSKSSTSSVPSENCEAAPPQKLTVENEASPSKEYTQINFSKGKKRRYDEEYLSFGFIPIGVDTFPDVRCVVCEKVLSNSSLALAKLKRHLESNHPSLKGKDLEFLRMKKDISIGSASSLTKYVKDENEKNTEASFILGYNIARAGKPHTIAKSLIKPSMIEVVSCILGEDAGKKVAAVQCSNNTRFLIEFIKFLTTLKMNLSSD